MQNRSAYATSTEARQAALFIAQHRLGRRALPALDERMRPSDIDAGYALQALVNEHLCASGLGKIVGHKVGATNPVLQQRLNIPHPVAGAVFETTVHHRSADLRHGDFVRPGVECEVVVRLGQDLAPRAAPYVRAEVEAAISTCSVGMEIIDDRYVDVRTLDAPTLIADNALDAGVVIGAPVTNWRALDLPGLAATTALNGDVSARGSGADVMGDPTNVVLWLANDASRRGLGLRAGEFIFTGSMVDIVWVNASDHAVVSAAQLGSVECVFR
jgi:2-keto-4-pentenoate hydratase